MNYVKTISAFKHHTLKWIDTNDQEEYLIYQKQNLYFIISKRFKQNTITLPKELQNTTLKDIYANQVIKTNETIIIPSYGFYIFQK